MQPTDPPIAPTDQRDELDTEGHAINGNVNESVETDADPEAPDPEAPDTEGHAMTDNVNETVETDADPEALDTEGHAWTWNVNETVETDKPTPENAPTKEPDTEAPSQ